MRRHQWLADRLDEIGMTHERLAAAMGVRRPAISEIIAGRRRVQAGEITKLSSALGIPAAEILTRLGHPVPRGSGIPSEDRQRLLALLDLMTPEQRAAVIAVAEAMITPRSRP